eukprot:jgi/Psemu1/30212/gm1.30212_g
MIMLPKKLWRQQHERTQKLGPPKYISQDNDVPEEAFETAARTNKVPAVHSQILGTVSDEFSDTAPKPNAVVVNPSANTQQRKPPPIYPRTISSLSEEDLNYRKHWRSVEKNFGLALNGQTYANTEFAKALSWDVSTSFTQLMTKVYIVSKIIQSELMTNFRKKSSTPSLTKKKGKKRRRKKRKWDNFQSLLWHVRGEREVGDTKPPFYGPNVFHCVPIKKYMIVYWEILDSWLYTKSDNGSSHNSQDYIAIMKELLDDLIAKSELQFAPQKEFKDYVYNKLMNSTKPRTAFCQALHFLWYREKDKAPPHDGDLDNNGDNKSNQSQDKKGNNGDDGNVTDGSLDNDGDKKPRNDGDNESGQSQDKGNNGDGGNVTDGLLDNNSDEKPAAKNPNESGNTAKTVGASHQWSKILNWLPKIGGTNWKKVFIGHGFALHVIKVMLKDPDPEILYPIYQIGKLLGDEYSISSLDSTGTSDNNERGSEYDPDNDGNSEGEEGSEISVQEGNFDAGVSFSPHRVHKTDERAPTQRLKQQTTPVFYHFETGFDAAQNGHLVLTLLEGCKQINDDDFMKMKLLKIWEETLKYASYKLFLDYEEGNTDNIDHVWAMGIILLYLLCDYPALKGTEDIKCYNNENIYCYDTIGIEPKADSKQQSKMEMDGNSLPTKEWCQVTQPKKEEEDGNKRTIQHWLHLYHRRWNSLGDLKEYDNFPVPCGARGCMK